MTEPLRVLLYGLPWRKVMKGVYRCAESPERVWEVESGRSGWMARLKGEPDPWPIFKTMKLAKEHCEERARHLHEPGESATREGRVSLDPEGLSVVFGCHGRHRIFDIHGKCTWCGAPKKESDGIQGS